MAWIGALAGTAANMISNGQAQGAQQDAIDGQMANADYMRYWGMPNYGKKGKQGMFAMLNPMLQKYLSGQYEQVMSPDLQDAQYDQLRRSFMEPLQQGRAALTQGMTNRGLDYGNIPLLETAKYDQRAADSVANEATNIATNAAKLNYGAKQDMQNTLLGSLTNLFRQGRGELTGFINQGVNQGNAALGAMGANNAGYWGAMGQSLNGALQNIPWSKIFGGNGQTMDMNQDPNADYWSLPSGWSH